MGLHRDIEEPFYFYYSSELVTQSALLNVQLAVSLPAEYDLRVMTAYGIIAVLAAFEPAWCINCSDDE